MDLAIPLLDIYPEKTKIQKDTCTPTFIAALDTRAKTWKQPKCPPTDGWMKTMGYTYTMSYHSAVYKKETMPLAATAMPLKLSWYVAQVRKTMTNTT